ncbi:9634_t:CDS:2 [Acaulospora colombiana]|uniref:9634_t:CDS:1 n=1 Tax=Acaulospora colombiana TaxID=27376 RepID=A0ACA9KZ54_9GLOM|nr:9634_t:CDS:2 [Acaulospora colombiana]
MCAQSQNTPGQKVPTVDINGAKVWNSENITNVSSGGSISSLRHNFRNNNTLPEQNITLQTVNRSQSSSQSLNKNEQQRHVYAATSVSRMGAASSQNSYSRAGTSDGLNAQKFGGSSSQSKGIPPQSLPTYTNQDNTISSLDAHPYAAVNQTPSQKSDDSHGGRSLQESPTESLERNGARELYPHGSEGRSRGIRYLQDEEIPRSIQTQSSLQSLKNRNYSPNLSNNMFHQSSGEAIAGSHRMSLTQYYCTRSDSDSFHGIGDNKGKRYSDPLSPISSSFTLVENSLSSPSSVIRYAMQDASETQQQVPEQLHGTSISLTVMDPNISQPVIDDSGKQQGIRTLRNRADSNGSARTASSKHSTNPSVLMSPLSPTSPEEVTYPPTSIEWNAENSEVLFTPQIVCNRYVITKPISIKKQKPLPIQSNIDLNSLRSSHQSDSTDLKSSAQSISNRSVSSQCSTSSRRVESLGSQRNQPFISFNANNRKRASKYYKGHVEKVPENTIIVKVFNDKMNFENEVLFLRKFIKSKYIAKLMDIETNSIFKDERESIGNTRLEGFDRGGTDTVNDDDDETKRRSSMSEISNADDDQGHRPSNSLVSFIITKYYGESLETNLHLFNEKREILPVFWNICEAARWLHDNGVVHTSLNPSSILCKETDIRSIKLSDFENARYLDEQLYPQFTPSTKTHSLASTDDSFTTPPSSTNSLVDDGGNSSWNLNNIPFQIQVTMQTITNVMTTPTLSGSNYLDNQSSTNLPNWYHFSKTLGSVEELEWMVRERKRNSGDADVDGENRCSSESFSDETRERENGSISEDERECDSLINVDETLNEEIWKVASMCLKVDEHMRWSVEDILASRLVN